MTVILPARISSHRSSEKRRHRVQNRRQRGARRRAGNGWGPFPSEESQPERLPLREDVVQFVERRHRFEAARRHQSTKAGLRIGDDVSPWLQNVRKIAVHGERIHTRNAH